MLAIYTDTLPVLLPASPTFLPPSFVLDLSRNPPARTGMSPLAPGSTTRWVNPAKEYDHRQRRTPGEAALRRSSVPYAVEQYIGWSNWYFDALQFEALCRKGINFPNGYRRSREEAWTGRWRHLPLTPNDQTHTNGPPDLGHIRCWHEQDY